MKIVVLTDLHAAAKAQLEAAHTVVYGGWAITPPVVSPLPTDAEIIALAQAAEAIIVPGELSAEVMAACPRLKVVGVARGDPRGVDLAAAKARGIAVVYAAGRNAKAVAELTLAFVLMLLRQLAPAHAFVGDGHWRTWDDLFATSLIRGTELTGHVLGLVGFGYVGREVARRAGAFDMRVLVYDPYVSAEAIAACGAEQTGLAVLLKQADVVSIHCKVTDETRGLLGAEELAQMRPGAYLINTARAAIVDEAALLEALRSGHLAGAALDVFWEEPLPLDSPWRQFPNVLHTPHIGGATTDIERRTAELVVGDVLAVLNGASPHNPAY